MFAIDRAFKHQRVADFSQTYATLFFNMFLEELYYMSMNVIGFNTIFLRANNEGENLYRSKLFKDCPNYIVSYDYAAEGCTPMLLTFDDLERNLFGL